MVLILNVYVSNVTEKEFNQEFDKLLDVLGLNLFFPSLFKFRKTCEGKSIRMVFTVTVNIILYMS